MNIISYLENKRVLVTGGAGFLGSRVVEKLVGFGVKRENISVPRSRDTDLRIYQNCEKAIDGIDVVIHLAGTVGGIGFNQEHPGDAYYDNLIMGAQLIEASRKAKVSKFVAAGTVCEYPKFVKTPFREDDLWSGYPEETNAPYGLAKKMMLVQSQAYRKQYGFNSLHLLLVNLYGPGDDFDKKSSHAIPALIRKVSEAMDQGKDHIEVWGTGKATREFLYVDDAAEAIVLAADRYNESDPINIGAGTEISIKDLVGTISKIMGFKGTIMWDSSKPDGQPRRGLDVSKAKERFGFTAQTDFETGLKNTIKWYLANKGKLE